MSVNAVMLGAPAAVTAEVPAPTWNIRTILFLALAGVVLGGGVSIIRVPGLASEDFDFLSHYNKVVNPLLVLLAFMGLMLRRRHRVDAFTGIALLLIPMGSVIGLLHGGGLRYFASHFFVGMFIAILYAAAYNTHWDHAWVERFVARVSLIVSATFAVALGVFWGMVFIGGRSLYLGVGSSVLLWPLAYYMVKRRWGMVLFAVLLIVLSGRRGTLLGMLTILAVMTPGIGGRRLGGKLTAGFLLVTVLVLASFLAAVDPDRLPPPLDRIASKWYTLNVFSDDFELGKSSSGRSAEIEYAFAKFDTSRWHWVSGMGYGWSYFNAAEIEGIGTHDFYSHYVHMSPLNFVFLYGVPMALLFFAVLWLTLARAYRWVFAHRGPRSAEFGLVLFVMGSLVVGFVGYNYATEPLIWLVFGLLTAIATRAQPAAAVARPVEARQA